MRVTLFPGALEKLAKSDEVKDAAKKAGEAMADSIRGQGIDVWDLTPGTAFIIPLPVEVEDDGTVVIAHPAGVAVQAKHGSLTKAAAAVGLEIKG